MKSKKFLFTSAVTLALLSAGISVPTFAEEAATNTTSPSTTQPSQVKSSIAVSLTETTTGNLIRVTGSVDSLPTEFINFAADVIDVNTGKIAATQGPVFLTLRNNQTSNHDDLYIGSLPDGTYKVVLYNEFDWESTTTDGVTYWYTGESATFQVKNGRYAAPGTTPSSSTTETETSTSAPASETETSTSASASEAETSTSAPASETETSTSTSASETETSTSTSASETETSTSTSASETETSTSASGTDSSSTTSTSTITWETVAGTWKNNNGQVLTIDKNGAITGSIGNGQLSQFTAMKDKTRGGFNADVTTSAVGHYGLAYMPIGAKASDQDASDKTKERILIGQSDNSGNLNDYFYRVETSTTQSTTSENKNTTTSSNSGTKSSTSTSKVNKSNNTTQSSSKSKAVEAEKNLPNKIAKEISKRLPNTGESTNLVYLVIGLILLVGAAILTKVKSLKK
ncbi:DUF6287 domain-containing protein [Streptococcus sp. SGI.013]|uniref:DUF6287 domain-containing protein n=1 Tax=unclassified Streptococcus TaxID=2608887 RepID=UPI003D03A49E